MELVGLPVYSWGCAAGHAIRMAARLTGRNEVLVPRSLDPERLSVIRNYCEPPEMASHIAMIDVVEYDPATGLLDLADLQAKLSRDGGRRLLREPRLSRRDRERCGRDRRAGAPGRRRDDRRRRPDLARHSRAARQTTAPTSWSARSQPLGVHMNCGGGVGGFIASRDEARYAREYPTLLISIAETATPGEYGFGMSLMHQSSYGSREEGKDWTGNSTYLWAIASAVYMSLMGPEGFREVGEADHPARALRGQPAGGASKACASASRTASSRSSS